MNPTLKKIAKLKSNIEEEAVKIQQVTANIAWPLTVGVSLLCSLD